MLFPAPSVRAEAEFEKNAYSFTLPTLGLRVQTVVAVTDVLPGLFALPPVNVKFTALADNVPLTDWLNTALRVMVCAAEFSTCARLGIADNKPKTSSSRPSFATYFISKVLVVNSQEPTAKSGFERQLKGGSPAPSPRPLSSRCTK